MINKILYIVSLLVLTIVTQFLATKYGYTFLWVINLPISTALALTIFDLFCDYIDIKEIKNLEAKDKNLYRVAMAILAAGFAIATAIFLR